MTIYHIDLFFTPEFKVDGAVVLHYIGGLSEMITIRGTGTFMYFFRLFIIKKRKYSSFQVAVVNVNEYHTIHTFGNPRHTQSMIAYMILT